jgi:hypothetical protein
MQRLAICNCRDAVTLANLQPARPADRSRAAPASHRSWTEPKDTHMGKVTVGGCANTCFV